jgi:hypothetical protein
VLGVVPEPFVHAVLRSATARGSAVLADVSSSALATRQTAADAAGARSALVPVTASLGTIGADPPIVDGVGPLVPPVGIDAGEVVTVTVVGVPETVPEVDRFADVVPLRFTAVPVVDALAVAEVFPVGPVTAIGGGVDPGSARATAGPATESAAATTATAIDLIAVFISRSLSIDAGRIGSGTSPARTRAGVGSR